MKQLLLITAISCAFTANVFAGSSCTSCQGKAAKKPAAQGEQKAADQKETDVNQLFAAMGDTMSEAPSPTMTTPDGQPAMTPDGKPADVQQLPPKMLLAGGTSPSTAPGQTGAMKPDGEKTDPQQDDAKQPQLVA